MALLATYAGLLPMADWWRKEVLSLCSEKLLCIELSVSVGVDGLIDPWYSALYGNDYFDPSGDTNCKLKTSGLSLCTRFIGDSRFLDGLASGRA